ncbi:MAG: fibronectin type III domain-containing protein [Deltaproteobacteria bacterium]|nr:fibronectin type III domain-containing protein [Deltaproteobacteria bacterium]
MRTDALSALPPPPRVKPILTISAILVLLFPGVAAAAPIWQDNFDSDPDWHGGYPTPGGWDDSDGQASNFATKDNVTHYAQELSSGGRTPGGKSLKIWTHSDFPHDRSYMTLYNNTPGSHRDIYVRWYMRIPVDLDWTEYTDYQKFWRYNFAPAGPNGGNEVYFNIKYSSEFPGDLYVMASLIDAFPPPLITAAESAALKDGNWHCLEFRIKLNSGGRSDGIAEAWIDGTHVRTQANRSFDARDNSVFTRDGFGFGNRSSVGEVWQHAWRAIELDDYVLSTTYVGPSGGAVDAGAPGPDAGGGTPGTVLDLAVTTTTSSTATLSFTEVADGLGQPARYDVRYAPTPIGWGTATEVSQGTCSTPMVGSTIGALRSCTVGGLLPGTAYDFQLVPFRGTLQVDAVFGPLSNVAQATTGIGPEMDAGAPDASPRPDATILVADAQVIPPDAGVPGAVRDLVVTATTTDSATLSFTEVDDGSNHPASYEVRFAPTPINWGTATQVSQGTCSAPITGSAIGALRSCTAGGLSPGTAYDFRLVPFRGTFQADVVFGPLSNVAHGNTAVGPGADAGAADASTCVPGGACTSPDGCRAGTLECVGGEATCSHLTDSPDGTPCPGSGVCNAGSCRYCNAGASCTSLDGCQSGTLSCATGEGVCTGLTNQPEGAACAAGTGTCHSGACSACNAGQPCTSVDGCQTGLIDCSETPSVCGSLGNRADGTACTGGACKAGVCRPCTPGVSCTLSQECTVGAIDCSKGEPVCRAQANLADGTPCSRGHCRSGECEADVAVDAGEPCGPGTHLDSATGQCLPDKVPDAGGPPPLEVGCGCGAGTGAPVAWLLAALVALRWRRRG